MVTPGSPVVRRVNRPWWWVISTYFAEGMPYSVIHYVANVLFTELQASLQVIGMTALFHLPWNLKFLWGPYVDEYGTKRSWLIWMEIGIAGVLVLLALATQSTSALVASAVGFIVLAFLSATQDVAVDGYYLEALDTRRQSQYVGLRAMAYRAAMLLVAGPLLVIIAEIGWFWGFIICAATAIGLAIVHAQALPRVEHPRQPISRLLTVRAGLRVVALAAILITAVLLLRSDGASRVLEAAESAVPNLFWAGRKIGWPGAIALSLFASLLALLLARRRLLDRIAASDSFYAKAFTSFLSQDQVGRILLFVVAFRAGESFLLAMRYPFFEQIGMSLKGYGYANGTFGMLAALIGAWGGGYIISSQGLRRWIWPFVIAQNSFNLLYVSLAAYAEAGHTAGFPIMATVITVESLGAGLGTSVFMVYLMRCTAPGHRAAHMAILTALMSVSFTLSGVMSGFLAEVLGFAGYFAFTVFIALPGMIIIPWLPNLDEPEAVAEPA